MIARKPKRSDAIPGNRHFDIPGWFEYDKAPGRFFPEVAKTTPFVAVPKTSARQTSDPVRKSQKSSSRASPVTVPADESGDRPFDELGEHDNEALSLTAMPDWEAAKGLEDALLEARTKLDPTSATGLKLMAAALAQRVKQKEAFRRCVVLREARREACRQCAQVVQTLQILTNAAIQGRDGGMGEEAQGDEPVNHGLRRHEFLDVHLCLVRSGLLDRSAVGKEMARLPHCYAPPAYLKYAAMQDTGEALRRAEALNGPDGLPSLEAIGHVDELLPSIPKESVWQVDEAQSSQTGSFKGVSLSAAKGLGTWDAGVQMWMLLMERGEIEDGLLTFDALVDIAFELADATMTHTYRNSFTKSPTIRTSTACCEVPLQEYLEFVAKLIKACVRGDAPLSISQSQRSSPANSHGPSQVASRAASRPSSQTPSREASRPSTPPVPPNEMHESRPTPSKSPSGSVQDLTSGLESRSSPVPMQRDDDQQQESYQAGSNRRPLSLPEGRRLVKLRESREVMFEGEHFSPIKVVLPRPAIWDDNPSTSLKTRSASASPKPTARRPNTAGTRADTVRAQSAAASPRGSRSTSRHGSWTNLLDAVTKVMHSRLRYSWPHPSSHANERARKLNLLRAAIKETNEGVLTADVVAKEFRAYCRLVGKRSGPLGYAELEAAFKRMPGDIYLSLIFRSSVVGREREGDADRVLRVASSQDEDQLFSFLRGLDHECAGQISEDVFCHAVMNGLVGSEGLQMRWHLASFGLEHPGSKTHDGSHPEEQRERKTQRDKQVDLARRKLLQAEGFAAMGNAAEETESW